MDHNIIKDKRNLFRLKKEYKVMKNKIIKDVGNFFVLENEEDYYKPVRKGNFWNHNYIEYESNSNKNKAPSAEEYLNKIRSYLKDIINHLKKSDT